MKILKRMQFGNPILRKVTEAVPVEEITSPTIQRLIADMRHTLVEKNLGVGLAAPQVGESIAMAVVSIRKSKVRPNAEPFDMVLINPVIIETIGRRKQLWEGCISAGSKGEADLSAKVPRYAKIRVRYYDEQGRQHEQYHEDLKAQVIQHETDHLNGILFVDRVKDTKTYMTHKEYLKRIKK
jgi:peptide deformylase